MTTTLEEIEAEHHCELGYTNNDDGVWLECSCGWRQNLGFSATPREVADVFDAHLAEVKSRLDRFVAPTIEGAILRTLSNFLAGEMLEMATEDVLAALELAHND